MATCSNLPSLSDQKKVCCVYAYTPVGAQNGFNQCILIGDGFSEADCTRNFDFELPSGNSISVPFGSVSECCRDCFPPEKKLVLINGRLVRNGGAFAMSPIEEPEKCCCGDECACKQVPDCEQVRCYSTTNPTLADKCRGRCVIKTYDEEQQENVDQRQIRCATPVQCCAEDNTTCEPTCTDGENDEPKFFTPAANEWTAMPCTTCGVCCVNNYDMNPESPTFREVLSVTGDATKTKDECDAIVYFVLDPQQNPLGPYGTWHAGTDNVNVCNPLCCQTRVRGALKEVVCGHTAATECDPCLGSCVEISRENKDLLCPRVECKTKQACCGEHNEKCLPQCGAATAQYRWEINNCGTDGTKCGKCCRLFYDGGGNVVSKECDATQETEADCVEQVSHGLGDDGEQIVKPYGEWHPFGTCADCNPVPCCHTITCPDGKTTTTCVNKAKEACDQCNGRCTELASGNQFCARYETCCGLDGAKCSTNCATPKTHSWEATCADPTVCGACCRIVRTGAGSNAEIDATCMDAVTNSAECVLNQTDLDQMAADPNVSIQYVWKPFKTCLNANCDKQTCCGEDPQCPQNVTCITVSLREEECDSCKGRCYDTTADEATCKTKQECCGADGALCRKCPNPDSPDPLFEWSGCFENSLKCGVCCKLTLDVNGNPVSSECDAEISYEDCIAIPNASWKPFETCASAVCIPRVCCNEEVCPDSVICIEVDKDRGACPDWCRGRCYAIDAAGDPAGPEFCATKPDCCGAINELCVPQPGLCPGGGLSVPTYAWPNVCADPNLCGTCCKKIITGGVTTYECDPAKTTFADCTAAGYGVWHSFASCDVCGATAQSCVETRCRRTVNDPNGQIVEEYSYAACKAVAPEKTTCKGICYEIATDSRTCKTKSACCGADNAKCGACDVPATHSWNAACIDGEKCGVCCITTNIGGVIAAGIPDENIGRAACEAKTTANPPGGIGITAVWKPFGTARDCSIERCCGTCADDPNNIIRCIDQPPGQPCLVPCNGKCYTVNALGAVDPTNPATCATKTECCIVDGIDVCRHGCSPGKRWEPTCPENESKCGVACKTTTVNGAILASICQPAIDTYTKFLAAVAAAAPGETFTWKAWDTCETAICNAKTCCGIVCPTRGVECYETDMSDPCTKCNGKCYDAIVNEDGSYTKAPGVLPVCSSRADCCGVGNEKCAAIQGCPTETPKIFEPCCPDDVFSLCQCAGGANTNAPNNFAYTSPLVYVPAEIQGNPLSAVQEQCASRLDGYASLADIETLLRHRLYSGYPGSFYSTVDNFCNNAGNLLPTFDWKDCYPELTGNEDVYIFAQGRQATRNNNVNGQLYIPPGFKSAEFVYNQKISLYICRGKKIINITDAVLTKQNVHSCKTETISPQQQCTLELIFFDGCDCLAANQPLPCALNAGDSLAAYGLPDHKFLGTCTQYSNTCRIAARICQFNESLELEKTGVTLPALVADCPNSFKTAGDARQIYEWRRLFVNEVCPPLGANQTIVKTEITNVDAFNLTYCTISENKWLDPDDVQQMPQPRVQIYTQANLPVPANCCRRSAYVSTAGINAGCSYDGRWTTLCGTTFDNTLPNTTPLGCPQELRVNPLP